MEKKWKYNETVHKIFIDFKEGQDSFRREILYNILIDFWVPVKLVTCINTCLNEAYSKMHICKNFSNMFPIKIV
jgi:hypothetical protein